MTKKRKWLLPVCIVGGVILLIALTLAIAFAVMTARGHSLTIGRCLVTDNGQVLLIDGDTPIELRPVDTALPELTTGDRIAVVHDGIQETYPAGTGVYGCWRLGGGSEADIPAGVIAQLRDLGWTQAATTEETPVTGYTWRAVRTDGYHDDQTYPAACVIRSVGELQDYIAANAALWQFDTAYDGGESFTQVAAGYDEAYFADRQLALIRLEEPSGSVRHSVAGVSRRADGGLAVTVDRVVPEVGTDDMAEWHLLIALPAEIGVPPEAEVEVIVNESAPEAVTASWNGVFLSLPCREGWEYEQIAPTENAPKDFGIRFWPSGQKNAALVLQYCEFWGVCGTGLRQEETTLAGRTATAGYYDGGKYWSYLSVPCSKGNFVVLNEGADRWWGTRGNEAMTILNAAILSE